MDYKEWNELSKKMAIKAITHDLNEVFVPTRDAIPRAEAALAAGDQRALDVEYRMRQALIALEELGYTITAKA